MFLTKVFVFFIFVCKTMCFYLKWCVKKKEEEVNTRKLYVKQ